MAVCTMSRNSLSNRLRKALCQHLALWVALFSFAFASSLYFINFGGLDFWNYLSGNREYWGQFGDFVGGMVNPLIGLVTIWLFTKSLHQNNEMLEASRNELRLSRLEIKRGIEVQSQSRRALEQELDVIEDNRIKAELEAVISHWEQSLEKLASILIWPPVVVEEDGFGETRADSYSTLNDLEGVGFKNMSLRRVIEDQKASRTLNAIHNDAFHIVDSLSRATSQLLSCIKTDLYKTYWSSRFIVSAERAFSWGALDQERMDLYRLQFNKFL